MANTKISRFGTDLENRAAAVADKKIADGIERDSGCGAHAFDPKLRAAVGRDPMDRAVIAAGDVEIPFAIERQARGIHQFGDERLYCIVRRDFVERDGNFLSALAAVGDVDVAFDVHGGIRDRVKIVGDLHAEMKCEGLALRRARFPRARCRPRRLPARARSDDFARRSAGSLRFRRSARAGACWGAARSPLP